MDLALEWPLDTKAVEYGSAPYRAMAPDVS